MAPLDALRVDRRAIAAPAADRAFFLRDTRRVARDLLGAWFLRRNGREWFGARIVEVEAYLGEPDAAAHSFRGRRTPRVEPMYGAGGLLYVFQVYGLHFCANLVTRQPGRPEAVLIRAASHPAAAPRLLSGPGRFCRALGIGRNDSGRDIVGADDFELRIAPPGPRRILASPRVGVDYAGEASEWPLRFTIRGDPAVSSPVPVNSSTR